MDNKYKNLRQKLFFWLIGILVFVVPAPNITISEYFYALILIIIISSFKYSKLEIVSILLLPFFTIGGLLSGYIKEYILIWITLLISSNIRKESIKLQAKEIERFVFIAITIAIFYLVFDSYFIRVSSTGRIHLSNLDPNFSGIGLLILFVLSTSLEIVSYQIIIIILSFITLSRASIFSIIIFYIALKIPIKNKNNIIPKFVPCVIIANVILYFVCSFFLKEIFTVNPINHEDNPVRVLSPFDESNYGRFIGFSQFYSYVESGFFNFNGNIDLKYRSGVPHNSLMQLIAFVGLPCAIIYLLIINKITNFKYNVTQMSFTVAYVFYGLFLHGTLAGYYFLMYLISMILLGNNEKSSFSR